MVNQWKEITFHQTNPWKAPTPNPAQPDPGSPPALTYPRTWKKGLPFSQGMAMAGILHHFCEVRRTKPIQSMEPPPPWPKWCSRSHALPTTCNVREIPGILFPGVLQYTGVHAFGRFPVLPEPQRIPSCRTENMILSAKGLQDFQTEDSMQNKTWGHYCVSVAHHFFREVATFNIPCTCKKNFHETGIKTFIPGTPNNHL